MISEILAPDTVCPPIGAGVLALQCREDDTATIDAVSPLSHPGTYRETTAERMFLHVLQGHCNSPIAYYATAHRNGDLSLRACVFTPDGKTILNARMVSPWTPPPSAPPWPSPCCVRAHAN